MLSTKRRTLPLEETLKTCSPLLVGVTLPVQIPEKFAGSIEGSGTLLASKAAKFRWLSTRVATGLPERSGLLKVLADQSRQTRFGLPLRRGGIGNAGRNKVNC